jgi:hypothetical protein
MSQKVLQHLCPATWEPGSARLTDEHFLTIGDGNYFDSA